MIETQRLTLIPCSLEHIEAFLRHPDTLAAQLKVTIPADFPVFPGGFAYWAERLRANPTPPGWNEWLYVDRASRIVIGDGGFKGPPNDEGAVEIGYALLAAYRGQGLATEAAAGLIAWAFGHPEVSAVLAETLAEGHGSIRVLTKLGMQAVGASEDPEEGPLIQWRLSRNAYLATRSPQA
jgi:RimJ/RimL family protein N-acetyltransferase